MKTTLNTLILWFTSSLILLITFPFDGFAQKPEVLKIWDKGQHNAFTDLVRYRSFFYCTFREGKSHVPKDTTENGTIRILRSKDGKKWDPVALLTNTKYDLRDPKISVTPENKLMVIMGGSHYAGGKLLAMMPHVSFSVNGTDFSEPVPASIETSIRTNYDWIWRITWNGNTGYGVVYQSRGPDNRNKVRLVTTTDGVSYNQLADFNIESLPNEATVRFDNENNMYILLRRESNANGMLGFSRPPYTAWKWTELGYRLGGPELMVLKNGNLCIASRIYKPESAGTVIYITGKEGNILKKIELPSSGDTSYPGLVLFKNTVWMSYYSSHEGKTSIYLAKVKIRDLMGN